MDPGNPVGEALNNRPKYVVSSTLSSPRWPGTTVLDGHLVGAGQELRSAPGGELPV